MNYDYSTSYTSTDLAAAGLTAGVYLLELW